MNNEPPETWHELEARKRELCRVIGNAEREIENIDRKLRGLSDVTA